LCLVPPQAFEASPDFDVIHKPPKDIISWFLPTKDCHVVLGQGNGDASPFMRVEGRKLNILCSDEVFAEAQLAAFEVNTEGKLRVAIGESRRLPSCL
jgi:hypothetical protein